MVRVSKQHTTRWHALSRLFCFVHGFSVTSRLKASAADTAATVLHWLLHELEGFDENGLRAHGPRRTYHEMKPQLCLAVKTA